LPGQAGPLCAALEFDERVVGDVDHGHAVAAGLLGAVEALVGDAEQVGETGRPVKGDAPDADRQRALFSVGRKDRQVDRAADALGNGLGGVLVDIGQVDAEFLAAHAADQVPGPQDGADRAGDDGQRLVARIMAEQVVDGLEIVGIDHQQGPAAAAPALGQQGADLAGEGAAIEAGGEAVRAGDEAQPQIGDGESAHPHAHVEEERQPQQDG